MAKRIALREDLRTQRGIIYRMFNIITGMSYVGQTRRTFYQRYRGRWWDRADNSYIRRAVRKYGSEAFYVEILETGLAQAQLDEREVHWIEHFRSVAPGGYNLHTGGKQHRMADPLRQKSAKRARDACRGDHTLVKDGREYRFTSIVGFANQMGLLKNMVGAVLRGKAKAHRGYHLPGVDARLRCKTHRMRYLVKDGVTYDVYNIGAFAREHKLRADVIGQLFAGKVRVHRGFHIPDLPPLAERKPPSPRISTITLVNDAGETLMVPNERRGQWIKVTGIDLYALLCGRRKMSRGYRIQEVKR